MAQRLESPNRYGGTTDHSTEIDVLRDMADAAEPRDRVLALRLAADLLEAHDQTGVTLDDWPTARQFVEQFIGTSILPSLV